MSRKDFQLSRMAKNKKQKTKNKKQKTKNKKRTLSGCVYNQNQTKPLMEKFATNYMYLLSDSFLCTFSIQSC